MRTNKPFRCVQKSNDLFEVFSLRLGEKMEMNTESKKFFDYINNFDEFDEIDVVKEYSNNNNVDGSELEEFLLYLMNIQFAIRI